MKKTVHVIAPFHTRLVKEKWSNCGFTQITLNFIKVCKMLGYHVIDYSNFGSESVADEHVEILSKKEYLTTFLDDGAPATADNAEVGSPGWRIWHDALCPKVRARVDSEGYHFVAHPFGEAAAMLLRTCPEAFHVETNIGYDRPGFGAYRIFCTEAWRNYHFGKYGSSVGDHRWSWVVPIYHERNEWPFRGVTRSTETRPVSFLGRLTPSKGISTIIDIAKHMSNLPFEIAGPGMSGADFQAAYKPPNNVNFLGLLEGKDRAAYYGRASVLLAPSEYLEPCGGVVLEAALCGTPSVASSWGGFRETIQVHRTGMLASTLAQWIDGVNFCRKLSRRTVADNAEARFTNESAVFQYDRIFEQLLTLKGEGWYTLPEHHLAQVV